MMRKIAALLIIAGIGIGAITVVKAGYYSPKEELSVSLPEAGLSEAPANQEEILPSRIIIPKLDIDTDVQLEDMNEALRIATNTQEEEISRKDGIFRRKDKLSLKEDWIIYVDAIQPKRSLVDKHVDKLKGIFPEFRDF